MTISDVDALDRDMQYKVLDAPNGYTGKFDESALPSGWKVKYMSDGATLHHSKGMAIFVR